MSGTNTTNTGTIAIGLTLTGDTTLTNTDLGLIVDSGVAVVGIGLSNTIVNAGGLLGFDAGVSMTSGGAVINQATGTIQGGTAIVLSVQGGSVDNQGLISAYGSGIEIGPSGQVTNQSGGLISAAAYGVVLSGDGAVTNQAGGTIAAGYAAVRGGTGAVGVTNAGTLSSEQRWGVELLAPGTIDNADSGLITGSYGGVRLAQGGSVANAGTITPSGSGGDGIRAEAGGSVDNRAGGVIEGGATGVNIYGGAGSLVNAGRIAGTGPNGVAVVLVGGGQLTNAAGGTLTGSSIGLYLSGVPVVAVNAGLIEGGSGSGIAGTVAATITNQAGGTISGNYDGIGFNLAAPTIVNAGRVLGLNGSAISADAGGTVTNLAGGDLSSRDYGVVIEGAAGQVDNAGIIIGTVNPGVYLASGGSVTNTVGGTIAGYGGVGITGGAGTVVNAGSIGATGQFAVDLAAGFDNRVVFVPGAVFTGTVDGGNTPGATGVSTLELASAAATGTISGLGSDFINFALITIDTGADWVVTGTNTLDPDGILTNQGTLTLSNATLTGGADVINDGVIILDPSLLVIGDLTGAGVISIDAGSTLSVQGSVGAAATIDFIATTGTLQLADPFGFAGLIGGFRPNDVIDLPDAMVAQSGVIEAGNILSITLAGGGMLDLRLDPTENFQFVTVNVNGDLITLNPPCFRAGTRIETTRGPVAVEALRIGDRVLTVGPGLRKDPACREGSGRQGNVGEPATRPVNWIGHRTVRCDIHPDPSRVWPVRVRAGAFADGVPHRDLWLSPDHAVFVDGVLVPVKHLIDGEAVAQVPMGSVTYFHVELPLHDVILADGLACESYLDSGDRANFANGGPVVTLHPDFARHARDGLACAPLHVTGPIVEAARQRLRTRSASAGVRRRRRTARSG